MPMAQLLNTLFIVKVTYNIQRRVATIPTAGAGLPIARRSSEQSIALPGHEFIRYTYFVAELAACSRISPRAENGRRSLIR